MNRNELEAALEQSMQQGRRMGFMEGKIAATDVITAWLSKQTQLDSDTKLELIRQIALALAARPTKETK